MIVLVLVLYVLAAMRVTRLVNFDMIMDWLHTAARAHVYKVENPNCGSRPFRWLGQGIWQVKFVRCPWCVGMWVSLSTTWAPILLTGLSWWLYPLLALSTSMVIGLLAPLSSDDDEIVAK